MIFSIQRYLEDYFQRLSLEDADQFAVAVANLYDRTRKGKRPEEFVASMHRIRTVFFRANRKLNRADFEKTLLRKLDGRFKKKLSADCFISFPGGVIRERKQFQHNRRRNIRKLLSEFKKAVESRAIDTFWVSRIRGQLRPRPEEISQALLAVFAKGVLGSDGLVFREFASGVGFVDVGIVFSARAPHLVELKILTRVFVGASQLDNYMANENRRQGWLVLVDSRPTVRKTAIPATVACPHGTIQTVVIDINPTAPSKR